MSEQENVLENVISREYVELGEIPSEGKHKNIQLLYIYGLPIQPTIILGQNMTDDDWKRYEEWIEDKEEQNCDFLIRTGGKNTRNSKSDRDPGRGVKKENLSIWLEHNSCVIVQAGPKEGINHDEISGVIILNPYIHSVEVFAHPDIATLSNRLNLPPWWKITMDYFRIYSQNIRGVNREVLVDFIKYRVARTLKGRKLPRIEDLDISDDSWKGIYEDSIRQNLDDNHAFKILMDRIDMEGIENIQPSLESLKALFKYLSQIKSILNDYPNFSIKFSILQYGDKRKLVCWDFFNQ
jgi:hypothetical protein